MASNLTDKVHYWADDRGYVTDIASFIAVACGETPGFGARLPVLSAADVAEMPRFLENRFRRRYCLSGVSDSWTIVAPVKRFSIRFVRRHGALQTTG